MIRVGHAIEWLWLPLGPGARVEYRSMSALDREAGRIAARRAARALEDGQAVLDVYGLPADIAAREGDAPSGEPKDADLLLGAGALISLTEIAVRCCRAWEGVGDAQGEPLPLDRRGMAALLSDPFFYDLFDSVLSANLVQMDAEGNGSAPSATGAQAGARTIADPAGTSDAPAPTASAAKAAPIVPSA